MCFKLCFTVMCSCGSWDTVIMLVCLCVLQKFSFLVCLRYIYIYIYICVCVCVCVTASVCLQVVRALAIDPDFSGPFPGTAKFSLK
jgi:hypothetical protein